VEGKREVADLLLCRKKRSKNVASTRGIRYFVGRGRGLSLRLEGKKNIAISLRKKGKGGFFRHRGPTFLHPEKIGCKLLLERRVAGFIPRKRKREKGG